MDQKTSHLDLAIPHQSVSQAFSSNQSVDPCCCLPILFPFPFSLHPLSSLVFLHLHFSFPRLKLHNPAWLFFIVFSIQHCLASVHSPCLFSPLAHLSLPKVSIRIPALQTIAINRNTRHTRNTCILAALFPIHLGTSNSAMKYPALICLILLEFISLIAADFYGQTIPGIRIRHPTHYHHSQIRRAPLSHRAREGDDNNGGNFECFSSLYRPNYLFTDYENSGSSLFGTDDEENRHRRRYNRLKVIREREINGIPIRFNSDYEQYEDTSEERIDGAKGPRNLKVLEQRMKIFFCSIFFIIP